MSDVFDALFDNPMAIERVAETAQPLRPIRNSCGALMWTSAEDAFLTSKWGEVPAMEIGAELGRGRSAVIGRAARLNLPRLTMRAKRVTVVRNACEAKPPELSQSPKNVRRRWRTANPDAPKPDLASTRGLGNMMQRLSAGEPLRAAEKPLPACVTLPRVSKFQCTIFDLTNETCRFPVGEGTGYQQMFCGAPGADLAARQPYCGECSALAYANPYPPRRHGRSFGRLTTSHMTPVNPQTDF